MVCSEEPDEQYGDNPGGKKGRHHVSSSSTERLPCEISREPLRPTIDVPGILAGVDDKQRNEFKKASTIKSTPGPTLHIILQFRDDRYGIIK